MRNFAEQLHLLYLALWDHGNQKLPAAVRRTLQVIVCTSREIRSGDLTLRAMSLVYTTLLALVPLLALSFSLFKAMGIHNQIEPMVAKLFEPLGDGAEQISQTLLGFIDNVKIGVLGSIGVAMLFYTVLAMIQKVEAAFNHIWNVPRSRPLGQRVSQYLVVLLLGPLALSLTLGITASLTSNSVVSSLLNLPGINEGAVLAGRIAPFIMICAVFTLVFVFIPNTRVSWRAATVGGFVSGLLWQSATLAFAVFVAGSSNYNAVYSSFAILIVLLIWLYIAWLILLVGCQIAFYTQNPEYMRATRHSPPLDPIDRESLLLDILITIGLRFRQGLKPIDPEALRRDLNARPEHLIETLDQLQQAGIIAEQSNGQLLLAKAPELLQLDQLGQNIRKADAHDQGVACPHHAQAKALAEELRTARSTALGSRTLADLLE